MWFTHSERSPVCSCRLQYELPAGAQRELCAVETAVLIESAMRIDGVQEIRREGSEITFVEGERKSLLDLPHRPSPFNFFDRGLVSVDDIAEGRTVLSQLSFAGALRVLPIAIVLLTPVVTFIAKTSLTETAVWLATLGLAMFLVEFAWNRSRYARWLETALLHRPRPPHSDPGAY